MLTVITKNWQTSKSTALLMISVITKNWKTYSNKILWGISWNCEDFKQGQPAKLAEAIPCPDNPEEFSEVVEKEPTSSIWEIDTVERWHVQLNCSKLMVMNSLFTYKHAIAAMLSGLINSSVMPTFIGSQRSFSLLHQNLWTLTMGMLSRKKSRCRSSWESALPWLLYAGSCWNMSVHFMGTSTLILRSQSTVF